MDVDYNPTGQEFVSGSYDKTVLNFIFITVLYLT